MKTDHGAKNVIDDITYIYFNRLYSFTRVIDYPRAGSAPVSCDPVAIMLKARVRPPLQTIANSRGIREIRPKHVPQMGCGQAP